ncbi:MAG: flagellar motor switch protein FliG [Treponema sp.]|nr:flagellar motor switch protein FliG [Treponema sp.]
MGNILQRGVESYRQTMSQNTKTGEPDGLLKTAKPARRAPHVSAPAAVPPTAGRGKDTKYRRVAKFLILIGGDRAAGILAELDPGQVEAISGEIASIRGIGAEEGEEILAEFRSLLSRPYVYSGSSSGGVEAARRILYAALGPDKGEVMLNKAVPVSKENVFSFLEEFAPEQIALLLKEDSPSAAALILSRLPPKLSAGTLGKFPPAHKAEILRRIARQGEVAPEVLERIASALKEKARHIGGGGVKDIEIDGMKTLAAILKQADYSFGGRIISELETSSPGIGKDLKDRLYTLDDVVLAFDRPLQEKLKTMSDREIAILLKGRSAEFSAKILACVSAGRRELIRGEGEILGAVPIRDCNAAAGEFLAWFRLAREEGKIMLASDEDVFV